MKGVWAVGLSREKNLTLAFTLDMGAIIQGELELAASSFYKIYVDGDFLAFGPQRAAHGYARKAQYHILGQHLTVEVMSLGVRTFHSVLQQPFFACHLKTAAGKIYDAHDFSCFHLTDRVTKVPRYSYQRGFAEVYQMEADRSALYRGDFYGKALKTEWVPIPHLLPSRVDEPEYRSHIPVATLETGSVTLREGVEPWRDRAHTMVGGLLEGYTIEEWSQAPTDEASAFVFEPGSMSGAYRYITYDLGRAITGFTELMVEAKGAGTVWFSFDELLWREAGMGENYIGFQRNTCASVHKWTFGQAGTYRVSTFEPYTVRYARIIYTDTVAVKFSLRDYENPNPGKFQFSCDDPDLQKIFEAAKATLAQNSVDLLTDCPSRERAGWLSDSFFSSDAEWIMTGKNQAEQTFLENYAYASCEGLPKGMIPMCYPSDVYPEKPYPQFIPNWSMWYILELHKYARRYGHDEIIAKSEKNVRGILDYFQGFENEFGMLEDLEGWVFVEWSAANEPNHIRGVNVPSNMLYAACLKASGELYMDQALLEKAHRVEAFLRENAFDGRFFVDNLIRTASGELVQSGLLTEVCQYYGFWLNFISKEEYPQLYRELMENLGENRAEGYLPEMGKPNVMYGQYMRIDLLMRDGKREQVLEECKKLLLPMALRTGTLWEHNNISASCDHGFAAYSVKWLIFGLTGLDMSQP
jgi:alpha-L-rhamnosidase